MEKATRRGYSPNDDSEFTGAALEKLKTAAADLVYLLDRGYSEKSASVFIGNHYLLTERQRTALVRTVSSRANIKLRAEKEIKDTGILKGGELNIDGFNAVISLEVALSGSPVFKCMDGTFRDLAGLRGTYGIIGKTGEAVRLIIGELKRLETGRANFFLDAPVSNSGRLKTLIAEIAEEFGYYVTVEVINEVDRTLSALHNVITGDGIILDRCQSWFNLSARIVPAIKGRWEIDITA